jgi:hypothetical protein
MPFRVFDRPKRLGITGRFTLAGWCDRQKETRERLDLSGRRLAIGVSLHRERSHREHRLPANRHRRLHAVIDASGSGFENFAERLDRERVGGRQLANERTRRL